MRCRMVSTNYVHKNPPGHKRRKPKKYNVCEEWFRKVYLDDALPTREIAEEIGCVNETVNLIAKRFGIEIRPRQKRSFSGKKIHLDIEILRRLYFDEMLSAKEAGDKV